MIQSTFAFAVLQLAVISLAAKLWLELRRDQWRMLLLRDVESTVNRRTGENVRSEEVEQFKRAA